MHFIRSIKSLVNFFNFPEDRRIVYYSEGKTYWPHLQELLKQFLKLYDEAVCFYMTQTILCSLNSQKLSTFSY